jgi:hypothetical protein
VSEGVIARREPIGLSTGLTGEAASRGGQFVRGELMGKSLAGVDVTSGDPPESGTVGLAWICGFSMEIALEDGVMRYLPLPDARPPINVAAMSGVVFRYADGHPSVALLKPGGPGKQAGLAVGDVIEQFGYLPAKEIDQLRLIPFSEQNAGKQIPIKWTRKADGQTIGGTLQLRKRLDYWHVAEW